MTVSKTTLSPRTAPTFSSYEEEAEFWDTHDLTDFADFDRPVKLDVSPHLSERVTLHIDAETIEVVRTIAREEGVPPEGLLELWIVERRDAERARRGLT